MESARVAMKWRFSAKGFVISSTIAGWMRFCAWNVAVVRRGAFHMT